MGTCPTYPLGRRNYRGVSGARPNRLRRPLDGTSDGGGFPLARTVTCGSSAAAAPSSHSLRGGGVRRGVAEPARRRGAVIHRERRAGTNRSYGPGRPEPAFDPAARTVRPWRGQDSRSRTSGRSSALGPGADLVDGPGRDDALGRDAEPLGALAPQRLHVELARGVRVRVDGEEA